MTGQFPALRYFVWVFSGSFAPCSLSELSPCCTESEVLSCSNKIGGEGGSWSTSICVRLCRFHLYAKIGQFH